MTRLRIRDASLFVEVVGDGDPVLLMHGGPGADHYSKLPPEAPIFAGQGLRHGWTGKDRLGDIVTPTLVIVGRDDFLFPPEHQGELAAGIPDARLRIVERAGHNAHAERPAEVMAAVRGFLLPEVVLASAAASAVSP